MFIGIGDTIKQAPTHLFFLQQSTLFGVLELKTWLVLSLFSWLYRAGLQASPMQATPGEFLFGLKITTKEGKISDVRICMTKELQFRACDEVNRNAARENYRLSIPEQ